MGLILILFAITANASTLSFNTAHTDLDGREWSFRLPGQYTNGEGPTVRSETSEAAAACSNIGGRLPSQGEYSQLFKEFGGTSSGGWNWTSVDKKGLQKLNKAFQGDFFENENERWWTSTVVPTQNHGGTIDYSEANYCYHNKNHDHSFVCANSSGGHRSWPRLVRCVR